MGIWGRWGALCWPIHSGAGAEAHSGTLPGTGRPKLEEAVWSCPTRLLSATSLPQGTYLLTLGTPYSHKVYKTKKMRGPNARTVVYLLTELSPVYARSIYRNRAKEINVKRRRSWNTHTHSKRSVAASFFAEGGGRGGEVWGGVNKAVFGAGWP